MPWLRTTGVNTNGAAVKVMSFWRIGKKVRLGTSGEIKVASQEYPKSPSVKTHEIRSDPMSANPVCPSPSARGAQEDLAASLVHHDGVVAREADALKAGHVSAYIFIIIVVIIIIIIITITLIIVTVVIMNINNILFITTIKKKRTINNIKRIKHVTITTTVITMY